MYHAKVAGASPAVPAPQATWVYLGALDHEDSMDNGSTIRPGDVLFDLA